MAPIKADTGKFLLTALPVAMLLTASTPFLIRQLWFDEALTILNFACMDSPRAIYLNYVIPNNQILYTVLLHYWMPLVPDGVPLDLWCRLPSLICAVWLLIYASGRFGGLCGSRPLAVALTALAAGTPFLIYATAVRGYMLGSLLVFFALGSASDYAGNGRLSALFRYVFYCIGAVAAVPSNLVGLAAAVLFSLPFLGDGFWRNRRFYLLAVIPVSAFLLVYLPIFRQFRMVMRLGEGWRDGIASLLCVYAAALYTFAMLLVPASGAFLAFLRPRYNFLRSSRAAIWLLPLPAALLLPVAPFPRIYFQLFPIFALLVAGGIRDLSALNIRLRRRWNGGVWFGALLILVVAWGWYSAHSTDLRLALSRRFGGGLGDDFFYGYYLRPEHKPLAVAETLHAQGAKTVYLSFLSDPWPVMFYHRLGGGNAQFLFDGPRGRIPALPNGTLVVLRRDEVPEVVAERFGIVLCPVGSTPGCAIFLAVGK